MKNKIFKKIIGILGYKLIDKNHIKNNKSLNDNSYLNNEKILNYLFSQKKIKNTLNNLLLKNNRTLA